MAKAIAAELHVYSCGHGDTLLLKLPNGKNVLIDCCLPSKAAVARFNTYLGQQGVRRLDWIFQTHPDIDHFAGMGAFLTHFVAEEGKELGTFCDAGPSATHLKTHFENASGATQFAALGEAVEQLVAAKRLRRAIVGASSRTQWADPKNKIVGLTPVAPGGERFHREFAKDVAALLRKPSHNPESNGLSIVLMLLVNGQTLSSCGLLAADAETEDLSVASRRWAEIANEEQWPASFDFLKVPHHGSIGSHIPDLCQDCKLDAKNRIAVGSVGTRKALPDRRVLASLLDKGWNVLLTHRRLAEIDRTKASSRKAVDVLHQNKSSVTASQSPIVSHVLIRWDEDATITFIPTTAKIGHAELAFYEEAKGKR